MPEADAGTYRFHPFDLTGGVLALWFREIPFSISAGSAMSAGGGTVGAGLPSCGEGAASAGGAACAGGAAAAA